MGKTIGTLTAMVTANTTGFTSGMSKAQAAMAALRAELANPWDQAKMAYADFIGMYDKAARRQEHRGAAAGLKKQLESMAPVVKGWQVVTGYTAAIAISMAKIVDGAVAMRDALDGAGEAAKLINTWGNDFNANAKSATAAIDEIERQLAGIQTQTGFVATIKDFGKAFWDAIPGTTKFRDELELQKGALEAALKVQQKLLEKEKERADAKELATRISSADAAADHAYLQTLDERSRREAEWIKRLAGLKLEEAKATDDALREMLGEQIAWETAAHDKVLADESKSDADKVQDRRTGLGDRVADSRIDEVRKAADMEQDKARQLALWRKANAMEEAAVVAKLQRELDAESDEQARAAIQELIDIEHRGRVAIDEDLVERTMEAIAEENQKRWDDAVALQEKIDDDARSRRQDIIRDREPLKLLQGGTAQAQAFVFDAMLGQRGTVEDKQLDTQRDMADSLDRIEENTSESQMAPVNF